MIDYNGFVTLLGGMCFGGTAGLFVKSKTEVRLATQPSWLIRRFSDTHFPVILAMVFALTQLLVIGIIGLSSGLLIERLLGGHGQHVSGKQGFAGIGVLIGGVVGRYIRYIVVCMRLKN